MIAEANDAQDDYRFQVASLAAYLAERHHRRAPPTWTGELRSGARANLLMGVGVEPRRREAGGGREPNGRSSGWPNRSPPCSCPPIAGPHALLDEAWREVIRNSAHDSMLRVLDRRGRATP